MRPALLLIALVTIYFVGGDPALTEAPAFLQSEAEDVNRTFTRCGPGRGAGCVVDGDTFKIGARAIRVVGIDAPETKARCPAEAAQAERATAELQHWLNRGPFSMTGRIDDPVDRYGRNLRSVKRPRPDGTVDDLAQAMIASGTVRRYWGGFRDGWC